MKRNRNERLDESNRSESGIARRSASVFSDAREMHLADGREVLVSRGSEIYRLSADGETHFVKRINGPRRVTRGMKITLR